MDTIDDFITLLHDELGLPVSVEDAQVPFDRLPSWDSLHMLAVLTVLERRKGIRILLPDAMEAGSLDEIYALSVQSS
ncbi:acyl carrier protein [Actinocrispum wychmicini]|uniref:Acyl carrier protein n=1 Tax=Actinocrispum wychmicini TaxID=1213861 RepID=A0A4R2JL62_9PSEU|nr:acyl carrier protein [Actinocrispum wychmicini]TCO60793.1 hypothetical protein EV192_103368 [Actinocrispum wychmicini]